jgi:hypothetical protein
MKKVIDDGFEALLEPFYDGKRLTDPISTKEDKFQLLPAFLKVKGLVKQHIDSYNWFVEQGIKEIVRANSTIKSDVESRFLLKYVDFVTWLKCVSVLRTTRLGLPTSGSICPRDLTSSNTLLRGILLPWNAGSAT